MRRGPRKWSEETIEKMQREGRGKGEKEKYLPWINVTEVSSLGRSRRVHGIKIRREHHFLSDVEWNLFLLLEHSQDIVDIREQYPLDRELTLEIAASLGIKHPCYPMTHVPIVMTTDFLVTRIRNGQTYLEAFDTKREQEAEDERSIEKLQIQRAYFDGMGLSHHLVFHSAIPLAKTQNLEWARSAVPKLGEVESFAGLLQDTSMRMVSELPHYSKRNLTLADYSTDFDYRNGYELGTGLRTARLLIATHKLITDLNNRDLQSAPLAAFQVAKSAPQLSVVGAA